MAQRVLTQKWLATQAGRYQENQTVYTHVDAALEAFPMLRPKTDVYTYDDGRVKTLLCVHGLLPIQYRGAIYNIPIACWIPPEYPKQPPMTYVVPTSDMLVRSGKNVNVSGLCTFQYLTGWETDWRSASLLALFRVMTDLFSQEPPVYSKPRNPAPSAEVSSSGKPSRPPAPPKSPIERPTVSEPRPHGAPHGDVSPPRLPRPPPKPSGISGTTFDSTTSSTIPTLANKTPPLPPSSIHPSGSHSPPITRPYHDTNLGSSSATSPPPPLLQHPSMTYPHPQQYPPVQPIRGRDLLDQDLDITSSSNTGSSSLPPSISPTAPPRPLNPEILSLHSKLHDKLSAELIRVTRALSEDGERLRATQAHLLAGEPAIRDEMARLEAVRDVCRTVAQRTKVFVDDAESRLAEAKRRGEPEVDELVCATSIVGNQLIDLVAEDNAIEDTLYHLHRALNAGRIDLDRYIKVTRELAGEQFMKRALIEKIHALVPLGTQRGWS
ncbi:UEV domain-containing protein [Cantharellus anzutake]|uniref:UEV domain-containing protein n=1 Tax=Cantharellus anzutake TaxID=1750568 RepID=UPI0019047752|nr:UEV domain-containing protein [Cantharellus anzutake]KAF8333995.1 UEV domain-containing protein [Cantharellus anzutake]